MRTVTNIRTSRWALVIAALISISFPLSANDGEDGYKLLKLDGYKVKWGEQTLGVGASISYAFADEAMHFADARNCRDLAPMTALAEQDIPMETLERETAEAFRVWERAADLSFHQVDDPRNANIVLGVQAVPRGRAFANVTYAPGSAEGVRAIDQSLVCLNPEQKWKVGFNGDKDVYDLRYTMIHEIGHAIGLDHPGPAGQLMGYRYTESFSELQPGDLRGARILYGHGADGSGLASNSASQSSTN